MKKFYMWLESDVARPRKVVLLSAILMFMIITFGVFVPPMFGLEVVERLPELYGILTAFIVGIYGFFTGTSSDKSSELADLAADKLMGKLKDKD